MAEAMLLMFQSGSVDGNSAPLLPNLTDIVTGDPGPASMHQKFKTFSRTPPNSTQQTKGKYSTLARVEKIPAEKSSKEFHGAGRDQGRKSLMKAQCRM